MQTVETILKPFRVRIRANPGVSAESPHSGGSSSRELLRRADTVGLLMRHTFGLVVAVLSLSDPTSTASPVGRILFGTLAVWSLARLLTRSLRTVFLVLDLLVVLMVCTSIPQLLNDVEFPSHNSAPHAIAGTAVISFAVAMPMSVSLPVTALIAVTYANGAAGVVGWQHVTSIIAIYYFFVQWATAAGLRAMLLRVTLQVDRARSAREAAELSDQITSAVREFDREQLALLHETAASTLLMVGQGAVASPSRLSEQAGRDLAVLKEPPRLDGLGSIDIVDVMHDDARLMRTSTRWEGLDSLSCEEGIARAICAAARETMNNVDRHANADVLVITVESGKVTFTDNGSGFVMSQDIGDSSVSGHR